MRIIVFLIFLVSCSVLFGQDTIRWGKANHYSSKKHPIQGKQFFSKLKYAREDIVLEDSSCRVEYCYYYDDERNCFGESYHFLNDTTIRIQRIQNDSIFEIWHFKLDKNESYFVWREFGSFMEMGFVKSLIPFTRLGTFSTQHSGSRDTLWATYHTINKIEILDRSNTQYIYPKAKVEGHVYSTSEIDKLPLLTNSDTLSMVSIEGNVDVRYCMGFGNPAIRTLTFLVDSTGAIRNIEQFEGNCDMEYCPFYVLELIKKVSSMRMVPGEIDGKAVNVRMYVHVDMRNEFLNRQAQHPAYTRQRE